MEKLFWGLVGAAAMLGAIAICIAALIAVKPPALARAPTLAHNDTVINGACGPEALQLLRDIDRRLVLLLSR